MAGLIAAELFPSSSTSLFVADEEEDEDLEILQSPSPFCSPSLTEEDPPHPLIDPDEAFVPVFSSSPDLTPTAPPSSYTTIVDVGSSTEAAAGDLTPPLFPSDEIHAGRADEPPKEEASGELGSGYLELGQKGLRVVEFGSGSEDEEEQEEEKDGILGEDLDDGAGDSTLPDGDGDRLQFQRCYSRVIGTRSRRRTFWNGSDCDIDVDIDVDVDIDIETYMDPPSDYYEEFEWEEVNATAAAAASEREMNGRSNRYHVESDSENETGGLEEDELEEEEVMVPRNPEWEVLAVSNVDRGLDRSSELQVRESYLGDGQNDDDDDDDGYVYTSEDDVLFGQFMDHDSFLKGTPPAARSAVENLPSVSLTEVEEEEDGVANNGVLCAVCKDEFSPVETVKQLPCLHRYHADCILPWLGMHNTCPVCRYELPTDDTEYESWKAARSGGNPPEEEVRDRYTFEMFPVD